MGPLTVLGEGELQYGGEEERQAALRVVDLAAALAEPAGLRLVGHLIQAPVTARQEDASQLGGGDGQHVGVVGGDGVEGVRQQLHCSRQTVI